MRCLVALIVVGASLSGCALPKSYYQEGKEYVTAFSTGRLPASWAMCDAFSMTEDEFRERVEQQRSELHLPADRPEMMRGNETSMTLEWSVGQFTYIPVVERGGTLRICPEADALLGSPRS